MKYFWPVFLLSVVLHASQPQSLIFAGYDTLSHGTFLGTALTSDGAVSLAPKTQSLAASLPGSVTAMTLIEPDVYWIAAAGPGSIWESKGSAKIRQIFQTDRPFVTAIVKVANGAIAAIVAPNAGVYVFKDKTDEKPQFFPVPKVDILLGAAAYKNDLYLVSGGAQGGQLLKMSLPSGSIEVLAHISETQATCIAIRESRSGLQIFFGGSDFGTIYRYKSGKIESIYAGPPAETTSIVVDKELRVYAAFAASDGTLAQQGRQQSDLTNFLFSWQRSDIHSSQVVVIEEHKAPMVLWQSDNTSAFSLFYDDASSQLFAGTGDQGRVLGLNLSGLDNAQVLSKSEENGEVVAIIKNTHNQLVALTAGSGLLTSIDLKAKTNRGSYLSPVIDASNSAQFGNIIVNDGRQKGFGEPMWRVGNTSEPDATWGPFTTKPGLGRFAQVKLSLGSNAQAVTQFRVTYLPINQKPTIRAVRLLMPNERLQMPSNPAEPSTTQVTLDKNAFQITGNRYFYAPQMLDNFVGTLSAASNFRTVYAWAQDPDLDVLRYRFVLESLSDNGDVAKRKLIKDWSTEPFVSFDAAEAGEGRFRVAVQCDDFIINGPGRALMDSQKSESFVLTSALPEFKGAGGTITNGQTELSFTVWAKVPLAAVQCADAKGNWFLVNPKDGIVDSEKEDFHFKLNFAPPFHSVTCQATDIDQNTRKIDIKVSGK